jgi:hypothetical protein
MPLSFEDSVSPCPCPIEVIHLLDIAVRHLRATGASEEMIKGGLSIKTYMEQPHEIWCRYIEN